MAICYLKSFHLAKGDWPIQEPSSSIEIAGAGCTMLVMARSVSKISLTDTACNSSSLKRDMSSYGDFQLAKKTDSKDWVKIWNDEHASSEYIRHTFQPASGSIRKSFSCGGIMSTEEDETIMSFKKLNK